MKPRIRQENRHCHDVLEFHSRGFQHVADVPESLACLLFEVSRDGVVRPASLTRYEYQGPGNYALLVTAGTASVRSELRYFDDFFLPHRKIPLRRNSVPKGLQPHRTLHGMTKSIFIDRHSI